MIAWSETSTAIKQGVADALDPVFAALATFGFSNILETVSFVRSVPDAQMFAANNAWFNALPKDQQAGFDEASRLTQIQTFAQIEKALAESMRIMTATGTKFYNPTAAEFKRWAEQCGESR